MINELDIENIRRMERRRIAHILHEGICLGQLELAMRLALGSSICAEDVVASLRRAADPESPANRLRAYRRRLSGKLLKNEQVPWPAKESQQEAEALYQVVRRLEAAILTMEGAE